MTVLNLGGQIIYPFPNAISKFPMWTPYTQSVQLPLAMTGVLSMKNKQRPGYRVSMLIPTDVI